MRFPAYLFEAFLLFLGTAMVANAIDGKEQFECKRPSNNEAGDFMKKIIEYNYCLDSDPVPEAILTPSDRNLFLKSTANGGGTALAYLGGGLYAYGNGGYMGAFFVYECPAGEGKGDKKGKDKSDKKAKGKGRKNGKGKGHKKVHCLTAGRRGAILVDAPPALGADLGDFLWATLDELDADLMMIIVTHEHNDHNGNLNAVLEANPTLSTFIASAETVAKIGKLTTPSYQNPRVQEIYSSNPTIPLYPEEFDIVIEEEFSQFSVGNQTLWFRLVEGHGSGNLLIWHEASKTIINIDPPFEPKWSPFFELAVGNDVPALFKLFDIYKEYPFENFVAGHSTHVGTLEDILVAERYVVDILDAAFRAVQDAAADPDSLANFGNIAFNRVDVTAGPNAGNFFVAFREYYAQLNLMCADIVLDRTRNFSGEEWVIHLAGVRATVFSHCSTIMFSLLTDAPGTIVQ